MLCAESCYCCIRPRFLKLFDTFLFGGTFNKKHMTHMLHWFFAVYLVSSHLDSEFCFQGENCVEFS